MTARDANDIARDMGVEALRAAFDAARPERPLPNAKDKPKATGISKSMPTANAAPASAIPIRWHGDRPPEPPPQLIKGLIPETGTGLLSGQWGTGKTFIGIDLSGAVMTGSSFAGDRVVRRGGVLFIAAEGASQVPIRLAGLVEARIRPATIAANLTGSELPPERLPFAWIEECPPLTDRASIEVLSAIARAVADDLEAKHGVPLVLIIVDTMAAAAGFTDENDAAQGQRAMNALAELSRRTGAFALVVDHFGKLTETGTRGSSAKEGAADVVLALLADREINGTTTNHRMAVRKVRGGIAGYEKPYGLDIVDLGGDEHGDRVTTCAISWTIEPERPAAKERWPKSLKIFKAALSAVIDADGKVLRPFGTDGIAVKAVPVSVVRAEFASAYPADGEDDGKRNDAKRKAFARSLKQAVEISLVASREIGGVDHLWFTDKSDERDIR